MTQGHNKLIAKKLVYLDNAATTAIDPEVLRSMKPFFADHPGNASEPHRWGTEARRAVNESRQKIADFLGAKPKEIIFTSGATEAINLAHKGLIESFITQKRPKGKLPHIVTSQVEHKAVIESCRHLERLGWAQVTYLPVDEYGMIRLADLEKAIQPETVLISIIYVNNEVGTIEPIGKIGRLVKQINATRLTQLTARLFFHTDATQGVQYLDCNVNRLGVDLLSFTGHKFYAPKGIGVLYIRPGVPIVRQQDGGGQEFRLRAGTENVPYIVGLGKAIEEIFNFQFSIFKKTERLRDKLITGVLKIPGVKLTGHPTRRAPHIASFTIEGVEGEAMLLLLSDRGIAASTGSACTSGTLEPSHVLTAMGISAQTAHGSLRFSLGHNTTQEDIDYVLEVLPEVIEKLRTMAPDFTVKRES